MIENTASTCQPIRVFLDFLTLIEKQPSGYKGDVSKWSDVKFFLLLREVNEKKYLVLLYFFTLAFLSQSENECTICYHKGSLSFISHPFGWVQTMSSINNNC